MNKGNKAFDAAEYTQAKEYYDKAFAILDSVREKLMLLTAREVAKLRKDLGVAASYEEKENGGYEVKMCHFERGTGEKIAVALTNSLMEHYQTEKEL